MTPRRAFLKQSAVIATALNPTVISAEQGEVLPIALIGCGGQGTNLLTNFLRFPEYSFNMFAILMKSERNQLPIAS
jgi:hypothetical protein